MTEHVEKIVPWGRSLDEYVRMFDLSPSHLASSILDCAAGPASFNAEMHRQGRQVLSCDPIYRLSAAQISLQIDEIFPHMVSLAEQHRANFLWPEIASPEQLGKRRMVAMNQFLADFPTGSREGRYLVAALPALPFRNQHFDLALCSHFLFTSTKALSQKFHLDSIGEMCRVARETRVFPLVPGFDTTKSPYLPAVIGEMASRGYACEVKKVAYHFQRGANEMLFLRRL